MTVVVLRERRISSVFTMITKTKVQDLSMRTTPRPEEECVFCEQTNDLSLLEGRIVYQDEFYIASHLLDTKGDSFLGIVLIHSKHHVHDLGELSNAEAQKLGSQMRRISNALKIATGAVLTYSYCFMEGVRHVHLFLASRYPNIPKEYVRLNIGNWPDAPLGGFNEVSELSRKLRAQLVEIE